jgi:outer membrane autotransporter protein
MTPSLRIDYTTVKNNGYTETGAGALSLNVDGQRAQELIIGGDAKLMYALSEKFSLSANAGLGYDALAKNAVIVSSFTGGGPAFQTEGVSPSHLVARGGAGVTFNGGKGWEVVGRYDVQARSKFTNQTVSLKIRKAF